MWVEREMPHVVVKHLALDRNKHMETIKCRHSWTALFKSSIHNLSIFHYWFHRGEAAAHYRKRRETPWERWASEGGVIGKCCEPTQECCRFCIYHTILCTASCDMTSDPQLKAKIFQHHIHWREPCFLWLSTVNDCSWWSSCPCCQVLHSSMDPSSRRLWIQLSVISVSCTDDSTKRGKATFVPRAGQLLHQVTYRNSVFVF